MSFKEKINRFLGLIFNNKTEAKQISDFDFSNFMREHNERALKGATSGKSYNAETFEKIWELMNFSNKEIFGIEWNELNREKIEKQLSDLKFKIQPSKSSTLFGFNLECNSGDIIDGTIAILKNQINYIDGIECSFGFIDKKADKLVGWLEKKYGKPLKLTDDTPREFYYDWLFGDIHISVIIVKITGLGDMTIKKCVPDWARMIRGELNTEESNKFWVDTVTKYKPK